MTWQNDTYWRDGWEWCICINRDIWFNMSLSTLPFFVIISNMSFSEEMITINYIAVISLKDYLKDAKNFHLIYCCCIIYLILKYNHHFGVLCFLFEIVMLFLVDSPSSNEVIFVIWNWITCATFSGLLNQRKFMMIIIILWNKIRCSVLPISYQVSLDVCNNINFDHLFQMEHWSFDECGDRHRDLRRAPCDRSTPPECVQQLLQSWSRCSRGLGIPWEQRFIVLYFSHLLIHPITVN